MFVLLFGFLVCCGGVFFFKQKTAYEMRISDWSSDVCSSDLVRGSVPRGQRVARRVGGVGGGLPVGGLVERCDLVLVLVGQLVGTLVGGRCLVAHSFASGGRWAGPTRYGG